MKREDQNGSTTAATKDGFKVAVSAIVENPDELYEASRSEADGIGLLSTDFLYANREHPPGEDEHLELYTAAANLMGEKPIVVRTPLLDANQLPDGESFRKNNSALGYRGIRVGLTCPELLKTQLRALLRANEWGNFKLLLSMVTMVNEVIQVRELLGAARAELKEAGTKFYPPMEVGVEVAVPAAVVMASLLAFEAVFFSISEELAVYTMAADPACPYSKSLLEPFEPTFLFQIQNLAEVARRRRKPVHVTAPLAGCPAAVPILVALGVSELVVRPKMVKQVKEIIPLLTVPGARAISAKAMSFWSAEGVKKYAEESLGKIYSRRHSTVHVLLP